MFVVVPLGVSCTTATAFSVYFISGFWALENAQNLLQAAIYPDIHGILGQMNLLSPPIANNNPLMDGTVTSSLKNFSCSGPLYVLYSIFVSPSRRRTPPVSGHLPLVPWVSAYGRFDCIH